MKNLFVYYLAILLPLLCLAIMNAEGDVTAIVFSILLLFYALVYHPLISGNRLLALKVISKESFYKTFIPFWNQKFFKALYFTS